MRRSATLLAVLAIAATGATAATAGSSPQTPVYVSLGDSVSAGVGASDPETTDYVALLQERLRVEADCAPAPRASSCRQLHQVDHAISGATTTTLIAEQLPFVVSELASRNHDHRANNDVVAVTFSIGGNDIFPLVSLCAAGITPECVTGISETFTATATNLHHIYGSLRAAAGPDTTIATMTLYNGLLACPVPVDPALGALVLEGGPGLPVGFNDIIRGVAAVYDIDVAETFGLVGADGMVGDCLHPNDHGYAQLTDAFAGVIVG